MLWRLGRGVKDVGEEQLPRALAWQPCPESAGPIDPSPGILYRVLDTMRKATGKRVAGFVGILTFILLSGATLVAWPHLVFRFQFERLGTNAQGLPEFRHKRSGIVFVRVPGGEFRMGSSAEDIQTFSLAHEPPQRDVRVRSFLLAKYEVTQAEWQAVMGNTPSMTKGDNLPVERVSWDDTKEFCSQLSVGNAGRFRLPTEEEWEYACRAGTTGTFGGTGILDEMGWHAGNSGGTQFVGKKKPNAWGLYDMHGNVWEWSETVHHDTFRVLRGGSWDLQPNFSRSASRVWFSKDIRYFSVGFRPVIDPYWLFLF
jgi:formylglycine-generating enzyme required for sulfatase activity